MAATDQVENVVIIGSGPAGYTAAIYAARAALNPLVFEGLQAGGVRGGQLMTTTEVENFPGFPEGITGPDLMDRMRQQAERWGARLFTEDVETLDLSQRPFVIGSSDRTVRAHSVILATGATALRLGIPSEMEYWTNGISACAICDGSSHLFQKQELAVVGGGDTATEEALYLTKYGSHIHLLVRRDVLRASKAMQERVSKHPNITVHLSTAVEDCFGDGKVLTGLNLVNTKTGEKSQLAVRGLFYGIGHKPNSEILGNQVDLYENGYVKVHDSVRTSVEGVYAAGDLADQEWRQAISAAGTGCQAALAAERYLSENNLIQEIQMTEEEQESQAAAAAAAEQAQAHAAAAAKQNVAANAAEIDLHADKFKGQIALRKLYHESDRLVTVLYTAPTCGPCRTLKPILNKVVDEYKGKIHFVEIDIEADPDIAEAGGINGTPSVQFFKDKALVGQMAGVRMKKDYKQVIEEYINN